MHSAFWIVRISQEAAQLLIFYHSASPNLESGTWNTQKGYVIVFLKRCTGLRLKLGFLKLQVDRLPSVHVQDLSGRSFLGCDLVVTAAAN